MSQYPVNQPTSFVKNVWSGQLNYERRNQNIDMYLNTASGAAPALQTFMSMVSYFSKFMDKR